MLKIKPTKVTATVSVWFTIEGFPDDGSLFNKLYSKIPGIGALQSEADKTTHKVHYQTVDIGTAKGIEQRLKAVLAEIRKTLKESEAK